MRIVLLLIGIKIGLLVQLSASIREEIIPVADWVQMTPAEAVAQLKVDVYDAAGKKLRVYISPEAALIEEKRDVGLRNMSLERSLIFLTETHGLEHKWKEGLLLIDIISDEEKEEVN
jgi:hypothetical protein